MFARLASVFIALVLVTGVASDCTDVCCHSTWTGFNSAILMGSDCYRLTAENCSAGNHYVCCENVDGTSASGCSPAL
ncbi:hypothetical protein HD554DRAFT_2126751 [Boletus coccyginus]|nr:hypothetical protein HD554DRAFT_2126751 [Boletus coccyginus]